MSSSSGTDKGARRAPIVLWALLGGFVGALVMGGIAMMMPVPMTGGAPFFVAAAMQMGLMGTMAWAAGWMLHLLTGLVVGAIFGVLVSSVRALRLRSPVRAISLGAGAGLVVWIVFFLPMMAALMPALMGMMAMIVGSLVAHLVFGGILGGTTYVGARAADRSLTTAEAALVCPACKAAFPDKEALAAHSARAHAMNPKADPATAGTTCPVCHATFENASELAAHGALHGSSRSRAM